MAATPGQTQNNNVANYTLCLQGQGVFHSVPASPGRKWNVVDIVDNVVDIVDGMTLLIVPHHQSKYQVCFTTCQRPLGVHTTAQTNQELSDCL